MRIKIFIAACVGLVGIFWAANLHYDKVQTQTYDFMAQKNFSTFVRDYSPALGSPDAKVILVEFMDPACGTCGAFAVLVKQLMEANPGKIKFVIRYAPFHEGVDYFIKILEASRNQGKYWETLDAMLNSQVAWADPNTPRPDKIWQVLSAVGMDLDKIRLQMYGSAILKRIEQDMADADTLNVRKTPGFFVNGKPLAPFGSTELIQLIQSEINAQYPE